MKVCMTTVVSADRYSYYIPSFVYTAKRAYPEYCVKIFVRGKLNKKIKSLLEDMKKLRMCDTNWFIYEDQFLEFPNRVSICNTLRHLLPAKHFAGFDYVYITDIDFIIFRHTPTIGAYFAKRIKETKQPYASFRGPYAAPRRPHITPSGWRGHFVRIADGTLMLKTPEWFSRTKTLRAKYKKLVLSGECDNYDREVPASYREYNEVMLYRICIGSKLKTPAIKRKFINGKAYNCLYRDIHVGDFRYRRQYQKAKMKRYIPSTNVKNFLILEQEEAWLKICKVIETDKSIRNVFLRMRKYMKKRTR